MLLRSPANLAGGGYFPLLHDEAHQPEPDEVEPRNHQQNQPQMAERILEDDIVVEHADGGSDHAEQPQKPRHDRLWHDVVEEIPEDGVHKHVGELEGHHRDCNNADGDRRAAPSGRPTNQPVKHVADLRGERHQAQCQRNERHGKHHERDAAAKPPPMPVAGRADDRVQQHVQDAGHGHQDHAQNPVRGIEFPEPQRDDAGHDRLHHCEAEVAPEQPHEHPRQPRFRIDQRTDIIKRMFRRRNVAFDAVILDIFHFLIFQFVKSLFCFRHHNP
jgi:hypothetical protein